MALTTAQLAVALRVTADPSVAPAEPLLSLLHRQLLTANSLIESYAPDAPEHVRDEAAIRLVGYLYEQAPTGNVSQTPIRHSGALPLLAPWHGQEPVNTGSLLTPTTPTTPESTLTPTHPVNPGTHFRYAGWSDDSAISSAELANAAEFTSDVIRVPARATNGWFFAAFLESEPIPTSVYIDGNPTNVIQAFLRQAGLLTRAGASYAVLVSSAEQSATLAGRTYTFGAGP